MGAQLHLISDSGGRGSPSISPSLGSPTSNSVGAQCYLLLDLAINTSHGLGMWHQARKPTPVVPAP